MPHPVSAAHVDDICHASVSVAAILGCLLHTDLGAVAYSTELFAATTHVDPRCIASCVVITTAIGEDVAVDTMGRQDETRAGDTSTCVMPCVMCASCVRHVCVMCDVPNAMYSSHLERCCTCDGCGCVNSDGADYSIEYSICGAE